MMPVRLSKVPRLADENLTIRLVGNKKEIESANRLVYLNYVKHGYWKNDESALCQNRYLSSPHRITFVAVNGWDVVGTASIIKDSEEGLPADSFQPEAMRGLRAHNEYIAEVSALAIDKSYKKHHNLIFYLYKYIYQYSFYYQGIDRFVIVCTPSHAMFYQSFGGMQAIGQKRLYSYVNVKARLLTVHLAQLQYDLYNLDEANKGNNNHKNNFYRFLLVDEHPNLLFPEKRLMLRPRSTNRASRANPPLTSKPRLRPPVKATGEYPAHSLRTPVFSTKINSF